MKPFSEENLWQGRIGWLVRGRWLLAAAVTSLGILAALQDQSVLATRILLSALGLGLINLAYAAAAHHLLSRLGRSDFLQRDLPSVVQLIGDVVCLTFLVHATGTLHSPFLFLLLFPAVGASVLLRRPLGPLIVLCCLLGPLVLQAVHEMGWWAAPEVPGDLPLDELYPVVVLFAGGTLCILLAVQLARRFQQRESILTDAEQRIADQQVHLERSQQREGVLRRQIDELAESSLIADMATRIAGNIREPLGIVRARAEALRLALPASGDRAELRHDVDVLLSNLESVHRGLRGILAFLPPADLREAVDLGTVVLREIERLGVDVGAFRVAGVPPWPRIPGSQDELELAVGLILRLVLEHLSSAPPPGSVRVLIRPLRRDEGRGRQLCVALRFPVQVRPPANATLLRSAVLARVVEKHGGVLERHLPDRGRGRLDLYWPLPLAGEDRPDPTAPTRTSAEWPPASSPPRSPFSGFHSRRPARSSTS